MDDRSIGVMDSGAGGFTVARAIRRLAPLENIVYFGDSRRNPYGERPREEIVRFAGEIRDFLLARQVKAVVIACNTITFNVPPSFFEAPVPVIGMSTDFLRFLRSGRRQSLRRPRRSRRTPTGEP